MEKKKESGKGCCARPFLLNCVVSGSLTLEAALSLTLFFFAAVLLSMPMELLDTQRKVQSVLEATSRDMSRLAYLAYQQRKGDTNLSGTEESGATAGDGMADFPGEEAAVLYLQSRIQSAVGEKRLKWLDVSGTRVDGNGEYIDLRARYAIRLPFSVFSLDALQLSSRSVRRGWIGRDGKGTGGDGASEEEEMVYVGKSMGRYHVSPSCHYISNEIRAISVDELETVRNASGSRYKPCHICGKAPGSGAVYILPSGEFYHSRTDCSSLSFYVRKVPLSEVRYLGACSYCGK